MSEPIVAAAASSACIVFATCHAFSVLDPANDVLVRTVPVFTQIREIDLRGHQVFVFCEDGTRRAYRLHDGAAGNMLKMPNASPVISHEWNGETLWALTEGGEIHTWAWACAGVPQVCRTTPHVEMGLGS